MANIVHMRHGECRPVRLALGRSITGPGSVPDFVRFLDQAIAELLVTL